VRQIAPEQFAPNYSDPNAPAHKPTPVAPAPPPKPVVAKPAKPAPPPPPPPVTPSRDKPYGACTPGALDWVSCLGVAAELADRGVEHEEQAVLATLGGRPGVNPLIADSAARSLRSAGEAWRILRDRECADLPLIEQGLDGGLYERRLRCRIRRDIDRIEVLRERYGPAG
jgi:uncharacterized protein YecT (DUF1311 family)